MTIPTNIIQSMLAINAAEIDRESIICQSMKDLRNYMSKGGARVMAEKWHKKVVKSKKRIAILSRNQKYLKDQLNENTFNNYIDVLTYVYEGWDG